MADVGVAATDRIIAAVKQQTADGKGLRDAVKDEIRAIFASVPSAPGAESNGHLPHVVLIVGVNGTGKTTTVGKLAQLLKSSGKKPLSSRPIRFALRPSSSWKSGRAAPASI